MTEQTSDRWLLPEGVEEWLPPDGWQIELLRRRLLDLYRGHGYELILPPLVEYLDSLLTGTGSALDLATFKLTDQLSGRMMGVRADVTPQAARIDANRLRRNTPTRLCYIDTVLRTRPATSGGPRTLRQVGCELFGHDGIASDLEVLRLMLATLTAAGVEQVHLDLGHIGVFRALAAEHGLSAQTQATVFDLLQRKSMPDLIHAGLPDVVSEVFGQLMQLNGDAAIIDRARSTLGSASPQIAAALDSVQAAVDALAASHPRLPVHIDLAELRGYHYHTGLVFGAFVEDHGRELARGGRYDNVGQPFGNGGPPRNANPPGRAATGFSANLHDLLRFGAAKGAASRVVLAPLDAPETAIATARDEGHVVVRALPGAPDPDHSHRMQLADSGWTIQVEDTP